MRIGIVDYLLRTRESACFYLAAELGFDCLDLSVERIGDPTKALFAPEKSGHLAELAKVSGVGISALVANHFLSENLLASDERRRRATWLLLKDLIQRAVAIGVPTVVLPLLGASDVGSDAETMALLALIEQINAWRDMENVRIALKSALPAEEVLLYLDRARPGMLGVCFDPSMSRAMGLDPVREVELLAGRILHAHFKDRSSAGPAVSLGSGDVNLKGVCAALSRTGYQGPIVLDTPAGATPVETARSNLLYCRRLVA